MTSTISPTQKRESMRPSLRFEVFKRDAFTCQYCGATAPDVLLEVDHIKSKAQGGDDTVINLITACRTCNSGKGSRELNDTSIVSRQKAQLDDLNERRLQLEMMLEWRDGLRDLTDRQVEAVARAFQDACDLSVNDVGRRDIKKWLGQFSISELLEALDTSVQTYIRFDDKGKGTLESAQKAFSYTPRIAKNNKSGGLPEHLRRLFYVRGILRNRLHYVNERLVMSLLEDAYKANVDLDSLEQFTKVVSSWSIFREKIEAFIASQRPPNESAAKLSQHSRTENSNKTSQRTPPKSNTSVTKSIEEIERELKEHLDRVSTRFREAKLEVANAKPCRVCGKETTLALNYRAKSSHSDSATRVVQHYCVEHTTYALHRAGDWLEKEPLCPFCDFYHDSSYWPCGSLRQFYYDLLFEAESFGRYGAERWRKRHR
ncbi:MAG: hypothetical protein GEU75_11305 [Dehalococcoidia bacterium]|nr:hypothetical protein [Dehalococcoidia bacterium]